MNSEDPVPKTTRHCTNKRYEADESENDIEEASSDSQFHQRDSDDSDSDEYSSSISTDMNLHDSEATSRNESVNSDTQSIQSVATDSDLVSLSEHEQLPRPEENIENSIDISLNGNNSVSNETESDYSVNNESESDLNANFDAESTSSTDSAKSHIDFFNQKLINNNNVSIGEMHFLLLSLYIRFEFTDIQIISIIKLINFAVGQNVLPTSKYLFEKEFLKFMPTCDIHVLCELCNNYVGKCTYPRVITNESSGKCLNCNTCFDTQKLMTGNFFITIPIARQLKSIYESTHLNKMLKKNLEYELNQPLDCISSKINSKVVSAMMTSDEQFSLLKGSITINTDGVSLHNSNTLSLWPLYFSLDQLPAGEKICLAGVWFGKNTPNMNQFLQSLSEESNQMATLGINWKDPDSGENKNTKIFVSSITADSPAKSKVLKMKSPSGYNACIKCRHPGHLTLCKRKKFVRYPPGVYKIRKNRKVLRDMKQAYKFNKSNNSKKKIDVNGLFGPSILISLPKFHIPRNISIDSMHCIDLGITRKLFFLFMENVGSDYYIGNKTNMKLIDKRLLCIQRTSSCSRITRSINEAKIFKATEWALWLYFDCFVALDKILPDKYLENLSSLSSAVYLLSKDIISQDDIYLADELIKKFVAQYQVLYKNEHCVYNYHTVSHIVEHVIAFGPLWCNSCEIYESTNSDIGKLVTGPANIPQQVAKKYLLFSSLQPFLEKYDIEISEDCKELCNSLLPSVKRKVVTQIDTITGLGNGSEWFADSHLKMQAFVNAHLDAQLYQYEYQRAIANGILITSSNYSRSKQRCDSYVRLSNNHYYKVLNMCKSNDDSSFVLLGKELLLEAAPEYFPSHIKKVRIIDDSISAHLMQTVASKLYFMKVGTKMYFSEYPNKFKPK